MEGDSLKMDHPPPDHDGAGVRVDQYINEEDENLSDTDSEDEWENTPAKV